MQYFDIWDKSTWPQVEVVGTHAYQPAIAGLFPEGLREENRDLRTRAILVPEPANPYDPNAVMVQVAGNLVGYLSREDAVTYGPAIRRIEGRGQLPQVQATVWASPQVEYDFDEQTGVSRQWVSGIHSSVRLALPEPHMWEPVNAQPPGSHVVLPVGTSVQVTADHAAQPLLAGLVHPEGSAWIYVSLHRYDQVLPRSTRTVVEVRVNGSRVGQMTPRMSSEFLPLLPLLGPVQCVAPGMIKGNSIKADVTVHAVRASELKPEWLARHTVRPELQSADPTITAVPSRPPGWYPDPQDMAPLRYWDGTAWTSRVRVR